MCKSLKVGRFSCLFWRFIIKIKNKIIHFSDNLFSFKSWMKSKFNCEEDMINKQFEIPEDLDYIET